MRKGKNVEFDVAMDKTRENLDTVFESWWAEVSWRCQHYDIRYWDVVQVVVRTTSPGVT